MKIKKGTYLDKIGKYLIFKLPLNTPLRWFLYNFVVISADSKHFLSCLIYQQWTAMYNSKQSKNNWSKYLTPQPLTEQKREVYDETKFIDN